MTKMRLLFSSFIVFFTGIEIYAHPDVAHIPIDERPSAYSCNFYKYLDWSYKCGSRGEVNYAIDYGYKFCNEFEIQKHALSQQGQRWLEMTKLCLQEKLVEPYTTSKTYEYSSSHDFWYTHGYTCQEIFNAAFDSHPFCYTKMPISICQLPKEDMKNIVLLGGSGIFNAPFKGFFQIGQVSKICLPVIIPRLKVEYFTKLSPAAQALVLSIKPDFLKNTSLDKSQHLNINPNKLGNFAQQNFYASSEQESTHNYEQPVFDAEQEELVDKINLLAEWHLLANTSSSKVNSNNKKPEQAECHGSECNIYVMVGEWLGDEIADATIAVGDQLAKEDAVKSLEQATYWTGDRLAEAGDYLEKSGKDISNSVSYETTKTADTIAYESKKIADATAAETKRLADAAADEVRKAADAAAAETKRVADAAAAEGRRLAKIAEDNARRLADAAAAEGRRLAQIAADNAKRIADAAAAEAKRVADNIADNARKATNTVTKVTNKVGDNVAKIFGW